VPLPAPLPTPKPAVQVTPPAFRPAVVPAPVAAAPAVAAQAPTRAVAPATAQAPVTATTSSPPTTAPAVNAPAEVYPGFDGPRVIRYVKVVAIKVRSAPSKEAPVVGWVAQGDKIEVVVNGDWAKLTASGQYLSTKYLVTKPPQTK
jgi:hypothetical protein